MKLELPLLLPLWLSCLCLLVSCSGSPNIQTERNLSPGNAIELKKPVTVPAHHSHVIFQDGKIININDLAAYRTSCILEVYDLGPTAYTTEALTVDRVEYGEEFASDPGAVIRYFTEIYLSSKTGGTGGQHKGKILICQILDGTMQYHGFAISEIRQATGDYFEF